MIHQVRCDPHEYEQSYGLERFVPRVTRLVSANIKVCLQCITNIYFQFSNLLTTFKYAT